MRYEIDRDETVTVAVVRAVSVIENRDPGSLPQLTDTIDPESLNHLFESTDDASDDRRGRISFEFSDSEVTIAHGERVQVEQQGETSAI